MRHLLPVAALCLTACLDWQSLSTTFDASSGCTPAAPSCPSGAYLCDSFEDGGLTGTWQQQKIRATLTIDGSDAHCAHRGERSVTARTEASTTTEDVNASFGFIDPGTPFTDHYARAFFSMTAVPQQQIPVKLLRVQQTGGTMPQGVTVQVLDGVFSVNNQQTATVTSSSTAPPLDRWFCLEAWVQAGTSGQIRVWLDGVVIPELDFGANTPPDLSKVGFGINGMSMTMADKPAIEVRVDDVALGTARLGCDP